MVANELGEAYTCGHPQNAIRRLMESGNARVRQSLGLSEAAEAGAVIAKQSIVSSHPEEPDAILKNAAYGRAAEAFLPSIGPEHEMLRGQQAGKGRDHQNQASRSRHEPGCLSWLIGRNPPGLTGILEPRIAARQSDTPPRVWLDGLDGLCP